MKDLVTKIKSKTNLYLVTGIVLSILPFFFQPIFNTLFESTKMVEVDNRWDFFITNDIHQKPTSWRVVKIPYEKTNSSERIYLWNRTILPEVECENDCAIYFDFIEQYYEIYIDGKFISSNLNFETEKFPFFHPINQSIIIPLYKNYSNKKLLIKMASDWGRIGIIGVPKIGKLHQLEKKLFRNSIGFIVISFIYLTISAFLFIYYSWNRNSKLIRELGFMSLLSCFLTFYHYQAKHYFTDHYSTFVLLGLGSLAFYPFLLYRIYNNILFEGENKSFKFLSVFYFFAGIFTCLSFFFVSNRFHFFLYGAWPFYTMRAFDIIYLNTVIIRQINKNPLAKILLVGMAGLGFCVIPNLLFQLGVFKDYSYFSHLGFFLILLSFLVTFSLKMRSELIEKEKYRLSLLLQTIHPHFLTNTLHSIISWLREEPEKASELVFSTARFLRTMIDVGQHQVIPIKQEIELCEDYLSIMQTRFEMNCKFEYEGFLGNELIPPFVIHTLVENSFKNRILTEDLEISFTKEMIQKKVKYKVITNSNKNKDKLDSEILEGIGFKYIRARLKETYGENYLFTYGYHSVNQFKVEIEILL